MLGSFSDTDRNPTRRPVVPQQCPETGSGFSVGGPIWADPIHDQDFVARLLDHVEGSPEGMYPSKSRIGAVLTNVAEELPDCPLYFDMHDLCGLLHVSPPKSELLRSAIVNAGYRLVRSSGHGPADATVMLL